jgi:hypothetical protein
MLAARLITVGLQEFKQLRHINIWRHFYGINANDIATFDAYLRQSFSSNRPNEEPGT